MRVDGREAREYANSNGSMLLQYSIYYLLDKSEIFFGL
jgi:hypothetical protein